MSADDITITKKGEVSTMKQELKGGDEFDCVSKWRKLKIITRSSGVWKKIKQKMNKRFRKQGRMALKSAEDTQSHFLYGEDR